MFKYEKKTFLFFLIVIIAYHNAHYMKFAQKSIPWIFIQAIEFF